MTNFSNERSRISRFDVAIRAWRTRPASSRVGDKKLRDVFHRPATGNWLYLRHRGVDWTTPRRRVKFSRIINQRRFDDTGRWKKKKECALNRESWPAEKAIDCCFHHARNYARNKARLINHRRVMERFNELSIDLTDRNDELFKRVSLGRIERYAQSLLINYDSTVMRVFGLPRWTPEGIL